MVLCQSEAQLLEHNEIAPHHLALGLLRLEAERGTGPFGHLEIDPDVLAEAVRAEAVDFIPAGPRLTSPPFTPQTKRVLEYSLKEALQMGHNFIGPGHILLGLVRIRQPAALVGQLELESGRAAIREYYRLSPDSERSTGGRSRTRVRGFVEVMRSAISGSAPGKPAGSQHILLTLVARQDTLAGRILAELGVTEEKVRELIDSIGTEGTLDEPPDAQVEVRLGDRRVSVSKLALTDAVSILRKKDPQGAADLAALLDDDDAETDPDA